MFCFLLIIISLLYFCRHSFFVVKMLKQFFLYLIGHQKIWHQMNLCLYTPRTYTVIALCDGNACYCYFSETIRVRLETFADLVHLGNPTIYLNRKDRWPLSSSYYSESFIVSLKTPLITPLPYIVETSGFPRLKHLPWPIKMT